MEEITQEEEEANRAAAALAPAIGYVRCISNQDGIDGAEWGDLTVGNGYKVLKGSKLEGLRDWLRVADDSDEDYLYPPECFEWLDEARP